MKMIKMALLGGAAVAVTAASAQADELEALKAQMAELNARMAAMETAPSIPSGYQLVAVSEGELQETPGLGFSARERMAYGNRSTIISVLPTADAPAGAIISWSGYARAGLVYNSVDTDLTIEDRVDDAAPFEEVEVTGADDDDDIDVKARGQIRVKASTDTAVGEVGVDVRIRANFDGVESEGDDFYMDVAYGYWAMTPELTFGGGYAGSLGEVGFSYDASCTCHYIDTVGFNPGDTTQMRLSYASGPFSMAIALEDGSLKSSAFGSELASMSGDQLGAAGEIKYSGDTFSAEVAGMWRGLEDDDEATPFEEEFLPDSWWQVGAGFSFGLSDMATFNIAAALGEGPTVAIGEDGSGTNGVNFANPWNNQWWGVSGLVSVNLSDEVHAELGAGYIRREFDDVTADFDLDPGVAADLVETEFSAESDRWVIGGGMYYNPVDQLTVGIEASYAVINVEGEADAVDVADTDVKAELEQNSFTVDLVSVWRF
ncbi:MAG: porin [Aestuariivirga sp.]|nr:porin [Aestuariivirga sp.]